MKCADYNPKYSQCLKNKLMMKTAIWQRAYAYHMCEFMGDYSCNSLFVPSGGSEGVVEQRRLPVCDQTPVLHRPGAEVRQSNLIWGGRWT